MHHHIVPYFFWAEHQQTVEVQIALGRAGAPPASLIADGDPAHCHTNNRSILCHTLCEILQGSISQGVNFFHCKRSFFFFVTLLYNLQMFLDPSLLFHHKPLNIIVLHLQRYSDNNTQIFFNFNRNCPSFRTNNFKLFHYFVSPKSYCK